MNRKILFTDLDGTLLNDAKEISPGNQAAINQALAEGHIIVIATGRPLVSAKIQAQRLGLTKEGCYAITFNGAQIVDLYHEKTIYSKSVPLKLVPTLFEAASRMGLHLQTYNDHGVLSEHETPELLRYVELNGGIPYQVVDRVASVLTEAPYKLIAIDFQETEKLDCFQQEVLSAYSGVLDSFLSSDTFLEIVSTGISKGFAVEWLCEYLGIPLENSIAAGDAQNDIPMLQKAHIGAVMCNAFPGVASCGNYITQADNNHDGVAEIIHRFMLSDCGTSD
jgi:Cof subfamily protein (haloacid dehalogenase superfamily)